MTFLPQILQKNKWTKGFIKPVFGATAVGRFGKGLDSLEQAQTFLNEWLTRRHDGATYLESVETEGEISSLFR